MKTLSLPHNTPVVAVDPLNDFIREDGAFPLWAKLHDSQEIRAVADTLRQMLTHWKGRAYRVLCASKYEYDQWKEKGLETLCTTDEGRQSVIDPSLFEQTIIKPDNSILTASTEDLKFLEGQKNVILTGLTTTSCIKKSIEQIIREREHLRIIVPRDAVAARESRNADAQEVLSQKHPNLAVLDSWNDIQIETT